MANNSSHNPQQYKTLNPCRNQVEMQMKCLDDLLPLDHKARAVWEFVEKMDTSSCFNEILTYRHEVGRPTTNPKVLLALWIYSILDGNISGRKIVELCSYHDAYKWIAGGTPINRSMISDFRSADVEKFDDLLTSCLALMVQSNVISDKDFSQDGTRVKANAGFGSFRTKESLEKLKIEMADHIKQIELELKENPNAYDARKQAAKKRAVQERSERIDKALIKLEEEKKNKIEAGKKTRQKPTEEDLKKTRASTTDPEVRKMKMGDSGFRLAFNVQFATGNNSKVIFGTNVVNTLDPGTSKDMMQQVNSRLESLGLSQAKTWNADSAYSSKDDVEEAANSFPDCKYYSPAKLKKGIDPKKIQKNDSKAVQEWRGRLDTDEMNESYKHRCSTAEFSNAQTKNHGMKEFLVRGLEKAKGMVNLHAIAHNMNRFWDLLRKEKLKLSKIEGLSI